MRTVSTNCGGHPVWGPPGLGSPRFGTTPFGDFGVLGPVVRGLLDLGTTERGGCEVLGPPSLGVAGFEGDPQSFWGPPRFFWDPQSFGDHRVFFGGGRIVRGETGTVPGWGTWGATTRTWAHRLVPPSSDTHPGVPASPQAGGGAQRGHKSWPPPVLLFCFRDASGGCRARRPDITGSL